MALTEEELFDELKKQYPDWSEWNIDTAKAANISVKTPTPEEVKEIFRKQSELFETVKEEIKKLAKKQKGIEKTIYEIQGAISRANVTLDDGQKLSDKFKEFVTRYRNIIKDSKEQASNMSSYARSWVQVILPTIKDSNASLDDVKRVFAISLEEAKARKDECDNLSRTMAIFVSDLKDFDATFQSWAVKRGQEVNNEIKQIQNDIAKIQSQLADVRTVMGSSGTLIGMGVSVGLFLLGLVLASNPITGFLGIGLWIFAGVSFSVGFGALIWAGVRDCKLSKELQDKQNKHTQLTQQLADIQQAQSALSTLPSLIYDFVEQFSSFAVIWDGISKMIQQIIDELSAGQQSNSITEIRSIATEVGEQWTDIAYLMDLYVANLI